MNVKNEMIVVAILYICLVPNIAFAEIYCEDNVTVVENMTIGSDDIVIRNNCDFGCLNFTISGLGNAGCKESPIIYWIMIAIVTFIFAGLIAWLYK